MKTLRSVAEGEYVRAEPRQTSGISINGVPADLEHTRKADVRIDLVSDRDRVFVAEHVLGPLYLRGITTANVVGIVTEWDFARPEHRFCYSTDLGPDAVVGHPAGLPNPGLAAALGDAEVVEESERARGTVTEPVEYRINGGTIRIEPRGFREGPELDLNYRDSSFQCTVPPGGADESLIEDVTNATTPYLAPDNRTAAIHAVADVLSDVVVIGGLEDVRIEAELSDSYHSLTIGGARRARDVGAYLERGGDR